MTLTSTGENCGRRPAPMLSAAVRRWSGCGAVCLWRLPAFCCFVSNAFAQYRFDSWTADTRLPQNIIRAIHQTPDGYLWLATLDGLARFGGVRFTVFNKGNSPGIKSNRFTTLYQDLNGALWLDTENSGLTRYYRGDFTTYTTEHGLSSNVIRGVSGDKDGNVWVPSGEKVMCWADWQFRHAAPNIFSIDPHCGQTIIHRDNRGGLWCVSNSSLSRFVNGQLTSWTRQDGVVPQTPIQLLFSSP
jgi:ligand-binding sensor domain-containing protein